MRPLLEHFRGLVRRGHSATVITSGHLWAERREALEALKAAGIHVAYERKTGDWGAMVGQLPFHGGLAPH
jgi:hypothetical protein